MANFDRRAPFSLKLNTPTTRPSMASKGCFPNPRSRVYALRFENLMTGNTFLEGHRLRLVVCGAFFPHFSRNLQTGALEMVSAASRPDRISLHHSRRYSSRLVLPVVSP